MAQSQDFKQASNRIFVQILGLYLLMFVAVWLVSRAGTFSTLLVGCVLALPLIGWCQFALFNALHEGLHLRFGAPHRDLLTYALCAWPLGFDKSYRAVHLDHHKYFGDPVRDPDFPNYADFPASRRQMMGRLLLNMSGVNAIRQFFALGDKVPSSHTRREASLMAIVLTQLLVAAVFAVTIGWIYYPLLWLLPLVTFGKFFSSTRTFCEHASPDGAPVIRTITGSFLGEKVFGVFCFHYHAEHHRFVGIPCDQLAAAHQALHSEVYSVEDDAIPRYELYQGGYFNLLRGWYLALPRS